jgi:thiol-disulfide isomerase/thioredoxin
MKPSHTIIGLVHAEWCGHCQELKPKWDEMRTRLQKTPSIEIKEVEVSNTIGLSKLKETHPSLEINGYPTIFKINRVGKDDSIQYYEGVREVDSLVKWAKSSTPTNTIFRNKTGGRRSRRGGRKTRKHTAIKSRKNKNKK